MTPAPADVIASLYKWRLDISIKCNRQQFNCVLPWSPRLYFVESVQLWLMMETKEPADITLCLHVLRSCNCLCGRDLRCNGGGRWYWLLYNNGHRLGVRSVQCHNRAQRKRSTELFTPLSLSLPLRPPKITSCAVSAPAPGPGLHDCMLQRHSQAIIVKIISCWCHKPFTLDVNLYFIYIFLLGNLVLKLFLLFTSCLR